jgi:putative ABC transport system permease protein
VGQGTTANITSRLAALGTNLLTINPSNGSSGLTLEDVAAIGKVDGVAAVAPELQTSATVAAGTKTTSTSVIGTNSSYAFVRAYDVWQGTFLTEATADNNLRVVVLGSTVADNLGLDASAVGSQVTIGGLPFQVIGITQPKGGAGFADPDDQVMVPVGVVRKYFVAGDTVRTVGVSVASVDQMADVKASIEALLRDRHDLAATATDDFSILDQSQLLDTANSIAGTLALLLGGSPRSR